MLTRFILTIDSSEYILQNEDISNWEDIRCSFKRTGFDGVVRSFSSEFEFVNDARDIILEKFIAHGLSLEATLTVQVIDDSWEYDKVFECPLDFSTLKYDNYVLKISSADNGIASVLKAKKSAKYEFEVGKDIKCDNVLHYDRIPMQESVTYGFTQGEQSSTSADITVSFTKDELPWVGNIGKEIAIGGAVFWEQDQDSESTKMILRALREVTVTMSYNIGWRTDTSHGSVILSVRVRRNGEYLPTAQTGGSFLVVSGSDMSKIGSGQGLQDPSQIDGNKDKTYTVYGETVWILKYNGRGYEWYDTGKTETEYFVDRRDGSIVMDLKEGDCVVIDKLFSDPKAESAEITFTDSEIKFSWMNTGEPVDVEVISPERVLNTLLKKITDGNMNVNGFISDYDERLNGTFLIAAESLRGLETALFYSSFSEFCDWMETVFGYIYYIGDAKEPRFREDVQYFQEVVNTPWSYTDEPWLGEVDVTRIAYFPKHRKFLYKEPSTSRIYGWWQTVNNYNDPVTGAARTDTLFRNISDDIERVLYFDNPIGDSLFPKEFDETVADVLSYGVTVYFVHRSELFPDNADVRLFESARDIEYSIDSSVIYSTVTIGYDKKEYNSANGRDEFNFNNTYTTGCTITDNKLSLLSKYRADSYGIEFAVQKRTENTTDSKGDSDVFFAHCKIRNGQLIVSRDIPIENTLSDRLFNGVFSPMRCVIANGGFIGVQASDITLNFTSSEGNSEAVVDGIAVKDDITLSHPIATCGILSFNTDEIDDIADVNEIIEIESGGKVFRGFIKEVDVRYSRSEQTKYQIIVKEIES